MGNIIRIILGFLVWKNRAGIFLWFGNLYLGAQAVLLDPNNRRHLHAAWTAMSEQAVSIIKSLRIALLLTLIGVVAGGILGTIARVADIGYLYYLAKIIFLGMFAFSTVSLLIAGVKLMIAKIGIATILSSAKYGEQAALVAATKALGFKPLSEVITPAAEKAAAVVDDLVRDYWAIVCGMCAFVAASVVFGLAGDFASLLVAYVVIIGFATLALWTGRESVFRKIAMPIFATCLVVVVLQANWYRVEKLDYFRDQIKPEAAVRVMNGTQTKADEEILGGSVVTDLKAAKAILETGVSSKCQREEAALRIKRAEAASKGRLAIVALPDCAAAAAEETKKTAAADKAKKEVDARRAAYDRVLATGKVSAEDKAVLNGVVSGALEIRRLEARRSALDECLQKRLLALRGQGDGFIKTGKLGSSTLPVCSAPAPVAAGNKPSASSGGKGNGGGMTDDQIALEALRQTTEKYGDDL